MTTKSEYRQKTYYSAYRPVKTCKDGTASPFCTYCGSQNHTRDECDLLLNHKIAKAFAPKSRQN